MAFVKSHNTIHICPECQVELTWKLNKNLKSAVYKHPVDGMIMINGYPSPCMNNNKDLNKNQTQESISLEIISGGYGIY